MSSGDDKTLFYRKIQNWSFREMEYPTDQNITMTQPEALRQRLSETIASLAVVRTQLHDNPTQELQLRKKQLKDDIAATAEALYKG